MGKVNEAVIEEPKTANVLDFYIKNKNGRIFNVLEHKTQKDKVFLRSGNKYILKPLLEIRQGIVDGTWSQVNEHEFKAWVKEDNEFIKGLTMKLFKRIVLCQLLIELDDELKESNEDNKYFRNILDKSIKASERIAVEQYNNLYGFDKDILVNIMNQLDKFTTNAATMTMEDFPAFNKVFEMYRSNPDQFDIKTFTFHKQI